MYESINDWVMHTLNGNIKDVWTKWRVHDLVVVEWMHTLNGRVHDLVNADIKRKSSCWRDDLIAITSIFGQAFFDLLMI